MLTTHNCMHATPCMHMHYPPMTTHACCPTHAHTFQPMHMLPTHAHTIPTHAHTCYPPMYTHMLPTHAHICYPPMQTHTHILLTRHECTRTHTHKTRTHIHRRAPARVRLVPQLTLPTTPLPPAAFSWQSRSSGCCSNACCANGCRSNGRIPHADRHLCMH